MAQQIINVGAAANDGTGDTLRGAFIKTDENFDELYTNRISGSGTDNYVPKFNGTNALENSLIFDNGTNVGIGTTSPAAKLDVHSVIRATNTSSAAFQNAALELFTHNGTSVSAGTSLFSTNSNFNYGTIISNQTNLYGVRDGGIRIATGVAPIVFSNGNGDIDFAAERMRITTGGNVGIGTTSPESGWKLDVSGVATMGGSAGNGRLYISTDGTPNGATYLQARNLSVGTPLQYFASSHTFDTNVKLNTLGTGLVYSNAGVLTSTNPSDERLKDDITDLEYGLNEILQLRPVSYNWKNDTINQGKQFGFIAQEVQEVMPELISEFTTIEDEEEVVRLGLDKEGIYATLVNAIKELKAEIEILKNK